MERKTKRETVLEAGVQMIGIAGTGIGVGTTHFAVMLLNYLTGCKRERTALMEWNDSGDLGRLERVCTGMCRPGKPFRVLEGDYYKAAGPEELARALKKNYQYILLDLGNGEKAEWPEFLRCGRQFLIGSFSEWQQDRFREFERKKAEAGEKSWRSLAVFGSEETRKEFKRRYRLQTDRIPFSADAFAVTIECRDFFDRLMSEMK